MSARVLVVGLDAGDPGMAYLLWTISEGGAGFGTKMPACKDALTREQIWQIVAYLRAGFPLVASPGGDTPKPAN